jgi:vancomycin permeability regulator SanA
MSEDFFEEGIMTLKIFLKVLVAALILWFCIHIVVTVIDGLTDEVQQSDVGIILGNRVEPDVHPSRRLQSRLDRAVELYNNKYFDHLIVSGGFGKEGYDEAKVMKDYLVKAGIPADSIIEDSKGENTQMTAKNCKFVMDSMNFRTATVITQYYHIPRSKLALHKAGIQTVYSAHARIFELRDIYSLFREFFGYYQYLLLNQKGHSHNFPL